MDGDRYPLLSAPLRLGPLTLANRLVFTAHLTDLADEGRPGPRLAAYLAARAAGGVGLVITEESTTDPTDRPYEKLIRGEDPAVVPAYRALTDAVHGHGVPVLAQLNHNGGQSWSRYTRVPVRAPSAVPDPLFREVPRALREAEIPGLVAGYAAVARRCVDGGFDGVEVQASQSSLVRQFLSRATNRRTDRWGGSLPARARFLLEVLATVRAAIGPDRVLGVRLAGEEHVDGGTTPEEAVEVARLVARTGLVQYLNTTVGVATASMAPITPPMTTPPGYAMAVAAAIRAAVDLPVIGVGRITTPAEAERALADGSCDLVGVVRGLVADPSFAAKATTGRGAAVRRCLGCNQECVANVGRNRPLGCVTNPSAGRETAGGFPALRARRRRVLVVGAGPAGLTAAAAAARAGCAVVLHERDDAPGGQLRIAAAGAGRSGLHALVDAALAACLDAGVELRFGSAVDAAAVAADRPDAVVLATGARPRRPAWAGDDERVVDVRAVLAGRVRPEGTVLVVDERGGAAAPSAAELLAGRGCRVELLTGGMVVAGDLASTLELPRWRAAAARLGIRQSADRVVLGLAPGPGVRVLHHPTGREEEVAADAVVVASHGEPDDGLWRALRGGPLEVHRIGDCRTPRTAAAATVEGERVAALVAVPAR